MLFDLLDAVPDYSRYHPLDAIYAHISSLQKTPSLRINQIAASGEGRPIQSVVCDKQSPHTALLWGFEDPDEPICGLTSLWLCDQLALPDSPIHRFQCNWVIIPCLNPDGAIRNEGWFVQPGDLRAFLNGSFEPPYDRYPFWNPPPTCREAKALRDIIMRFKPDILFPMHDESHYPAPGYEVILSEEISEDIFSQHFTFVRSTGMQLLEPSIRTCFREPERSFAPAFVANPSCLVMTNETCGYRVPAKLSDTDIFEQTAFKEALDQYLKLLQSLSGPDNELLQSALYFCNHVRQNLGSSLTILKPLAMAGCGLRILRQNGLQSESEYFEQLFWRYIQLGLGVDPEQIHLIPLKNQVQIQLHFLFTVLSHRGFLG